MERLETKLSHDWHAAINRFNERNREQGLPFNHTMYRAKDLADEVPRLTMLFKAERTDTLAKVHQPCSCCAPRPIAKNELTCCLGIKCAACPMLHALEKTEHATPDQIDQIKAWTCAAHILEQSGAGHVDTSEGFILTTDDRMYWNGVYESLATNSDHPDDA